MVILKKLLFSEGFRGGPTFVRGDQLFQGVGVQMLISIETHITCEFPGGPEPLSPLWNHTCRTKCICFCICEWGFNELF